MKKEQEYICYDCHWKCSCRSHHLPENDSECSSYEKDRDLKKY